jgi:small ligand-binding sensory domain FIST
MSLFANSHFASAAASGADWREASIKVLEELEGLDSGEQAFNIGFLYISDHLVKDAGSILSLFQSVLKIQNWVGTVGIGVCGCGESFIDKPAIAAMVGRFAEEDFCIFPDTQAEPEEENKKLKSWLETADPMMLFVHGDPLAEEDPARTLVKLEQSSGGYLVGGLSSSRHEHIQFAGDVFENNISGVAFSQNIRVATALSQGCTPIGPIHAITRGDDHTIRELDMQKASEVFENDLRSMAIKKIDRDPDTVHIQSGLQEIRESVPDEFKPIFRGEVHAAFPVSQSDQNDYLVRNIIGLDPEEGAMVISQSVMQGESIMFVHRDDETVRQDLSKTLLSLRERVKRDTGEFKPKAALYVSCVARAFSEFDGDKECEMKLVREVIGDIPMAGFYAGGEICNARLYGYTGIITLFL